MQKILLVYNILSSGVNPKIINEILKILKEKKFLIDKIETSKIGEATQKIKDYLRFQNLNKLNNFNNLNNLNNLNNQNILNNQNKNDLKMVIVVGGDGIINEAVNALAYSDIPLGIIPRGTGNVFAKDRKIPFSIKKAIEVFKDENIKEIDLGLINETKYYFMMCSCGFDVKAISNISPSLKKKFKILAYIYHGVKAFFTYKPSEIILKIPQENILCKGYFCIISNVRSYGIPIAQIAPSASINDGLLDVCVFINKSKFSFIANILAIFIKMHINFKNVFYTQTSNEIILENDNYFVSNNNLKDLKENSPLVQIDGDVYCSLPVKIKISKKALKIFLP